MSYLCRLADEFYDNEELVEIEAFDMELAAERFVEERAYQGGDAPEDISEVRVFDNGEEHLFEVKCSFVFYKGNCTDWVFEVTQK